QVAKDSSFYASLRPGFTSQEYSLRSKTSNGILETTLKESVGPNERIDNCSVEQIEEIKDSDLDIFLEEIRNDYQNASSQYRTALDKFIERYRTGAIIRTQVESVKCHKLEGNSGTRRLRNISNKVKENLDPQTIPCRKKRKVNKREHSLGKNVAKNQLN
ncbi:11594_t:CDS:2, partial [Gigaspora rosea]